MLWRTVSASSKRWLRIRTCQRTGPLYMVSYLTRRGVGIAALLSGLATYCNKVGHHSDREWRDESGDLQPMPLDQWEADLAVAVSQFALTYALRLRQGGLLLQTPLEPRSTPAAKGATALVVEPTKSAQGGTE
jgi:hypothetical protein